MIISASSCPAQDEKDDENLMIREAGNPVTSLINLPVQENISFGIGEYDRTMHVIKIQPIRFSLRASSIHRIRSRTIIPLVYAPDVTSPSGGTFGLSDIIITGFFSPRQFGRFLWGAGPVISFPTATDPKVGTGKWSAGPSLVLGAQRQRWLAGIIAFNIWSFAGKADRADVNRLQIDALFRYHLGNRWILVSSPTIVADWKAPPGNKWIVPVGGGIGRIWLVDGKGIGFECQAFYNAVHPDDFPSADWTLRFQVQFIGSARR
jgi:hypothetical protein